MAKKSSRDGRQQSRLIRGNKNGFTISTIDHLKDGRERLDATITYDDNTKESIVFAHPSEVCICVYVMCCSVQSIYYL